jgi:hypothetical protein
MEIQNFRIAQTLSICILLAASAAFAQNPPILVHVPFDFVVMEKVFPAGEYRLTPNTAESMVLIKSADDRHALFVLTHGLQSAKVQDNPKLVFYRYGEQYYLSEVWSGGTTVGHQLPEAPAKRLMAKRSPVNKVEIAAGVRGREAR